MSRTSDQAEALLELVGCPECQAAVDVAAKKCWLCGHAMGSPFQAGTAKETAPTPAAPQQEMVLNVSLAVMAALLVVVTVGVGLVEPAYGIGLAFVLLPAIAITLVSGLISRASGKAMSPLARFTVFLKSVAVMFGVAVVMAAVAVIVAAVVIVSLIIAFFEACFKMLGG